MNVVILFGALIEVTDNCIAIIDKLIAQRKLIGMTQVDLANATNLTQSVIARFESKKTTPKLDTLLKISYALGCDIDVIPWSGSAAIR